MYKSAARQREENPLWKQKRDHALTRDAMDRFYSKVKPNPKTGCLEWTGGKNKGGYGVFNYGAEKITAHRAAWMIRHVEPVPEGKHVCHTCDNPGCVNPEHLFIGTDKTNQVDRSRKHRIKTGRQSKRPTFSIPKEEVLQIRAAYNQNEPHEVIADRHRITPAQVHEVAICDNWPWLT